jgi:hypothetical protein
MAVSSRPSSSDGVGTSRSALAGASDRYAEGREFERVEKPHHDSCFRRRPNFARSGGPLGDQETGVTDAPLGSRNEETLRFAGLLQAADGTRTHDLLHGNRLRFPHKRFLARFSPESDYRGLPGIRRLLVPSVSTPVRGAGPPTARLITPFGTNRGDPLVFRSRLARAGRSGRDCRPLACRAAVTRGP